MKSTERERRDRRERRWKYINNTLFVISLIIMVWIIVSFLITVPYYEEKPTPVWSFFYWLLKLCERGTGM